MRPRVSVLLLALMTFGVVFCPTARASLIYLYDFPGNPGSGLASDQANGQPSGATFSDFTRTNLSEANGSAVFNSTGWNQGGTIDVTQFVGFSIAANAGLHLNLNSLTFDASTNPTGPANAEVALFLNGSSTAYATFDFSPTIFTVTHYTFNFTPLTDLDNVTSASFQLYGWNDSGNAGQFQFDNVATYGDISSAPEPVTLVPILVVLGCAIARNKFRR